MRYALLPYLYSLAREANLSGMPLVRPLYLEFPEEAAAYHAREEYCLGPYLLVIPATGSGDAENGVYRTRAYFPPGDWYELEGTAHRCGSARRRLDLPLEKMGLFVRGGAVLPCAPVGDNSCYDPSRLELDCYPAENATEFVLYEDDGDSLKYLKGEYCATPIRLERSHEGVTVRIGPPQGRRHISRGWKVRVRMKPRESFHRVQFRYGRGPWRSVPLTEESTCLAGEVHGCGRFAVAAIPAGQGTLTVRFRL